MKRVIGIVSEGRTYSPSRMREVNSETGGKAFTAGAKITQNLFRHCFHK